MFVILSKHFASYVYTPIGILGVEICTDHLRVFGIEHRTAYDDLAVDLSSRFRPQVKGERNFDWAAEFIFRN